MHPSKYNKNLFSPDQHKSCLCCFSDLGLDGLSNCLFIVFLCCCTPNSGIAQLSDPVADSALMEAIDVYETTQEGEEYEEAYELTSEYTPPPVPPVAMRDIDKGNWDDATNNLDYSKDLPEQPKETGERPNRSFDSANWNATTAFLGKVLQILAIILAIVAIVYGIYRSLQAPRNRRIGQAEDGTIITPDNVDAYIHETDLERFLREALAAGNYPLCIRLYYLQVIKLLSEKGAIKWAKEKTNRDYLREMRSHSLGREFREATRTFERVWYGNEQLDASTYAKLEPAYKSLIKGIQV